MIQNLPMIEDADGNPVHPTVFVDWKARPEDVVSMLNQLMARTGMQFVSFNTGCDQCAFSLAMDEVRGPLKTIGDSSLIDLSTI